MNRKNIMGVPILCFWAVTTVCTIGIIIGSFFDYSINVALANKTEIRPSCSVNVSTMN